MPNMVYQKDSAFRGFTDSFLNTQSILDVFVLQDLIDPEDADKLKNNFRTNREVEKFLLKNHLVTKDTINKAYSIILKIPFIGLSNVEIPDEAINLIPKSLAIKYGIIPFYLKDNLVRLAISKPADLLVGYADGLSKIFESKNLSLELFITGESDFAEAIKQFNQNNRSNDLLLKHGSLPVMHLRNFKIPKEHLTKIPQKFIEKYRMVIFGKNIRDYLIACETPDSVITKRVLEYIEKENNVRLEVFATSKDDIDYVLSAYFGDNKKPENKEADKKTTEEKKPEKDEISKPAFSFSLDKLFGNEKNKSGDITIDSVAENEEKEETEANVSPPENFVNKKEENVQKAPEKEPAPKLVSRIKIENVQNETIPKEESEKIKVPVNQPEQSTENEKKEDDKKVSFGENMAEIKDLGLLLPHEVKTEKDLEEVSREGYVPKIVAATLSYALNKKVSDIHIEPQSKVLRIRTRIDGILGDAIKLPLSLHPPIISRIKILSRLKIDETRIPQDGRFDVILSGREVDVRVSSLPTVHGEKIVMRILDKNQKILSLEDLGMQGTAFTKTINAIGKPWGIILSTGPTGSGKSTTLNAIISRLNQPGVNISTLEDPVEYETPGVNQTQVKPEIGFTFASGLRSLLRQDPNIIMVGEIRDGETAAMATHAALTGHLVLSTLHTNDTAGCLPRLINMGIEPFLITSSMDLILAQRLVRKICPDCKEEAKLPPKIIEEIKKEVEAISPNNIEDRKRIPGEFKLFYGKGCANCNHGYKGRIGLFEVMDMSPAVEELAISKRPANEIKITTIKEGMITMKQDGILKALNGMTTIDEVFQATSDK